jgi:Flp pilus assembly protein TadD
MTEKKSSAAAGATPAGLSAEQLLTEIGKLVYQLSKQGETLTKKIESLDAVSKKLDAIESLISGGLFERLDKISTRLAEPLKVEMEKAVPGPLDAQQAVPAPEAPPALLEKLGALAEGFEALQKAVADSGKTLSDSFGSASKPVTGKLESMEQKLGALQDILSKPAQPVDMSTVVSALADLRKDLGGFAQASRPGAPEVPGLAGAIADIRKDLSGIQEAVSKPAQPVDFSGVIGALAEVRKDLAGIQDAVSKPGQPVDFTGVVSGLSDVRKDLSSIQEALSKPGQPIDFSSITGALGEVRSDLSGIGVTLSQASGQVDLSGVLQTLSEIKSELSSVSASITFGVGSSLSTATEAIEKKIESHGEGFTMQAGAMVEALKSLSSQITAFQEAAVWKELPESLSSAFDGVKMQINTTSEALGDAIATSGRECTTSVSAGIETLGGLLSRTSSSGEMLSALESIRTQLTSASESITAAVSTSGVEGSTVLGGKLDGLSSAVSALPGTIRQMQEALATQFGDFSGTARETLAGVQTSVESSRKILQSMEAASGKAIDEQKETLVKMADLLKVHSEQVVRAEVEDLNNEGIHLMNEGRYAEATAALEKAVQIDPSRPELWSNLGHVRAASGQLEEAEESFRKALSLDTALEPALSGLGVLLVRAGRPRETLEFLRKQLEGGTASAGVVVACSRALATSGRHADAVSLLQKAAAASPGNADLEAELSHYSEKR